MLRPDRNDVPCLEQIKTGGGGGGDTELCVRSEVDIGEKCRMEDGSRG